MDAVQLHFVCDAQGRPMLVRYNGTDYAYLHSLQGDIVSIVAMNGTAVVEYGYDAWGKPISTEGSMAGTLGKDNPFRYRGYVWDEETGLYYLRSRYYDPSWGRFVNADAVLGKQGRLLDHNVFHYCHQNPVNRSDLDGNMDYAATLKQAIPLVLPIISPLAVVTPFAFFIALFWPAATANSDASAIPDYDGLETFPTATLPSAYVLPKTREATDEQTVTITDATTARTLDPTGTVQYWEAYITPYKGIGVGAPLGFTAARNRILSQRDVLAKTPKAAIALMMATGSNIGPEIHGMNGAKGFYMPHYHIKRKNKGHIFFFPLPF